METLFDIDGNEFAVGLLNENLNGGNVVARKAEALFVVVDWNENLNGGIVDVEKANALFSIGLNEYLNGGNVEKFTPNCATQIVTTQNTQIIRNYKWMYIYQLKWIANTWEISFYLHTNSFIVTLICPQKFGVCIESNNQK